MQIGKLLNIKQIIPGIIPVSPSTFLLWVKQGKAPQPVKISGRTFWRAADIKVLVQDENFEAEVTV